MSGGGDPVLKVWDWMSGKLLSNVPVFEIAESYIKIKAPKRRRGGGDGDGEDEGGEGEAAQKKGKRGRRKRVGKTQDKNQEASAEAEEQEEGGKEEGIPANGVPEEVLVFVVNKIDSVDLGERGRHIIFSVVG